MSDQPYMPGEVSRRIGASVRILRAQQGLRGEDLAHLSSLTKSTISKIEVGKRGVSADEFVALAEALNVGLADLLDTDLQRKLRIAALRDELASLEGSEVIS